MIITSGSEVGGLLFMSLQIHLRSVAILYEKSCIVVYLSVTVPMLDIYMNH